MAIQLFQFTTETQRAQREFSFYPIGRRRLDKANGKANGKANVSHEQMFFSLPSPALWNEFGVRIPLGSPGKEKVFILRALRDSVVNAFLGFVWNFEFWSGNARRGNGAWDWNLFGIWNKNDTISIFYD